MTLPTINDVRGVDPILTNMLVGYQQADSRFVASRVFPSVPVRNSAGTYFIFTKKYWFRTEMQRRAPGSQYARAQVGVETSTYATAQWALAYPVADEIRADSQIPMDLETAAVRWLNMQSALRKEISWAAEFMVTGVWGTSNSSVTAKWSDYTLSDPVNDVNTAKRTISQNTGYTPNTMVMGEIVRDRLVDHPDLLDRIKYTAQATTGMLDSALADIFNMPNLFVGTAVYSNTNEAATFSSTPILDDDCLIVYTTPNPSLFEVSGGYTFNWPGGGGLGTILRNREDTNDTDLIKIKEQWDQKIVASDLGYIYLNVTD
jgi:hypothetical protein